MCGILMISMEPPSSLSPGFMVNGEGINSFLERHGN